MGMTTDRQKGVVMCTRCRNVYSVWIRSDGTVYAISSHNNCTCDERNKQVLDDT